MALMSEEQRQRALEAMREALAEPPQVDGKTPMQRSLESDKDRIRVIEEELSPLLGGYFDGRIQLSEFKSKVDGINKRNELWGFKGIKGQMFFNMVVNVADDLDECDQELKAAIAVPANEQIASSRIKTFASYVRRLGKEWVEAGNTKYGRPKVGSVPFFLSYFWQIEDRETWPAYYTNSVQMMTDLNLWQPSNDLGKDYLAYKRIHEELAELFTQASGQPFGLYTVEHIFWIKGRNPFGAAKVGADPKGGGRKPSVAPTGVPTGPLDKLPESYVPPVVAVLPRLARNEDGLADAAKRSGTSLDSAFEKHVNAAFTILGYDTKLLGQGRGRVPDGLALYLDNSYAIVWDGKVRSDGYSMGTDDRTIREYIITQSRELKRRQSIRNVYYFVISSQFAEDYDDAIRSIKMGTDVSEVLLVEADAIVAMVDAKLRDPQQVTLGPDGLQHLFSTSGVLTADAVREQFA